MPVVLRPLAYVSPIWSLLLLSVALGICMLWVFGRMSDQKAIRRTRNRLKASLMEMRLFGDEPALLLRAQKDLLTGNARLLVLTLRPALVLTLPLLFLVAFLEPFYGRAPLPVGQPAILTVHLAQPINPQAPVPKLEAPSGLTIETPAVRAISDQELSWRIRPQQNVEGTLRVVFSNETLEKTITAGNGRGYASDRRASAWTDWILYPSEPRIKSQAVDWIEVRYPSAGIQWLGLELHWLIWLLVVSMLTALLFKRRMGVSF
jgi:uncharacterized membrane protein (DUF106 family)